VEVGRGDADVDGMEADGGMFRGVRNAPDCHQQANTVWNLKSVGGLGCFVFLVFLRCGFSRAALLFVLRWRHSLAVQFIQNRLHKEPELTFRNELARVSGPSPSRGSPEPLRKV